MNFVEEIVGSSETESVIGATAPIVPEENTKMGLEVWKEVWKEVGPVDVALLNLVDCAQDRVFHWHYNGGEDEPFDFIGVLDGHGRVDNRANAEQIHFVDRVERLPDEIKHAIFRAPNPMQALIDYFAGDGNGLYCHTTGAVASFARIYADRVETFNVGDAASLVFVDDRLRYMNEPHTSRNEKEQNRLKNGKKNYYTRPSYRMEVISTTDIRKAEATYTIFCETTLSGLINETMLAPTQSLGHNDVSGYDIDVHVVPLEPNQKVHVVVTSDGVMDMVYLPEEWNQNAEELPDDIQFLASNRATEIAAWGRRRWNQEWTTHVPGYATTGRQKFPENKQGQDDIGVVTFTRLPEDVSSSRPHVEL